MDKSAALTYHNETTKRKKKPMSNLKKSDVHFIYLPNRCRIEPNVGQNAIVVGDRVVSRFGTQSVLAQLFSEQLEIFVCV